MKLLMRSSSLSATALRARPSHRLAPLLTTIRSRSTVAQAPAATMNTPLAAVASSGFRNAAQYDTFRPSYPAAAVDQLLRQLGVAGLAGARIVEVAAGTGKFTELLMRRPEAFDVVAVEPHADMRQSLVDKQLPGALDVVDGTAASIPLEEENADAVIAAQAFHWFATRESLQEFHRVLKDGASFGMIWNVEDYNAPRSWDISSAWEKTLNDILWRLEDNHPRFRHLDWRKIFANQHVLTTADAPFFSIPIGTDKVRWSVWLSEQGVWDRFATLSQIANLDAAGLATVKAEFAEAMEGAQRNENGEVEVHGVTYFAWTTRV